MPWIEKPVRFGTHPGLEAILTLPTCGKADVPCRSVIMMNAGIGSRTGTHRSQVMLSRECAERGILAMRLDLPGLGESPAAESELESREQDLVSVRLAIDFLFQKLGVEELALYGLCSGADLSHRVALADPRVTSVVLVDGYAWQTFPFHFRRIFAKLCEVKRWKHLFFVLLTFFWNVLNRLKGEGSFSVITRGGSEGQFRYEIEQPARRQAEEDYRLLAERGVRQLHLFTQSADYVFNARRQFLEMYPTLKHAVAKGLIDCFWLRGVDHAFSVAAKRKRIVAQVAEWLSCFESSDFRGHTDKKAK